MDNNDDQVKYKNHCHYQNHHHIYRQFHQISPISSIRLQPQLNCMDQESEILLEIIKQEYLRPPLDQVANDELKTVFGVSKENGIRQRQNHVHGLASLKNVRSTLQCIDRSMFRVTTGQ